MNVGPWRIITTTDGAIFCDECYHDIRVEGDGDYNMYRAQTDVDGVCSCCYVKIVNGNVVV